MINQKRNGNLCCFIVTVTEASEDFLIFSILLLEWKFICMPLQKIRHLHKYDSTPMDNTYIIDQTPLLIYDATNKK